MIHHLANVPLFRGLPFDQLRDLADIAEERRVERGTMIFHDGDEGNGFYVVIAGRVKIYKLSFDGKEQILHLFGPGEPFGEVPVFAGQRFPANAQSMEPGLLLFFPREAFVELITGNPFLALNMLAVLSVRLRRFAHLIDDLSLKEVPGRLAAYLLYLSERKMGSLDFELGITKGQLAALLGTIPETLSRILSRMKSRGLIETEGRRIRILDLEGLETLRETGGRL
ncbi:MAG: Crp/Fnr family transcriptional regulator [Deltaproteobacteria bacterium]|nr:Crp/Fnr family transcriptional regulator [Deltaproteobacteria bacterium]MBW2017686.1 Crp/Fnr family transcriptional regulator [Deltaproteobacteria bacterium]MBW2130719.1 Crp/Fnr family transcriptional regulator [Deltaproteobacteria bacterium]